MEVNNSTIIAQALILLSGRVQGVYMRVYARQQGLSLGLDGYAKNLADGRVEIKALGSRENIEKLIQWCRQGSPQAKVEKVEYQWQAPDYGENGFLVL